MLQPPEMHASCVTRLISTLEERDGVLCVPRAHGSFAAPFAGIHGWYWKNRTEGKVTIKLTTTGFYSESLEFRSGMDVVQKQFQ